MNKISIILSIIIVVMLIAIIGVIWLAWDKSTTDERMKKNAAAEQNINSNNSNNFMIQGMKVEILKQGTGEGAKNGDSVTVNYSGTLTDGTPFDSSLNPGRTPFEFSLPGQVIQGWNLGVLGMKVGEKRKLTIPPELAYGERSPSPLIPANSTLVFEIDMLSINGK